MRILILKEKHGTQYYDVSTEELLHKTCVAVLKRRLEDGWYGTPEEFVDKDIEKEIGLSEEAIQKLPKSGQEALNSVVARIRSWNIFNSSSREFLKRVQEAFNYKFNEKDKSVYKRQAYQLLAHRSDRDYEYERIDLEEVNTVEE